MVEQEICIALLLKAPVAGSVKTRMSSELTEEQALRLHKDLFLEVFSQIQHLPIDIWITEPSPWLEKIADTYNKRVYTQQGSDLGERMKNICGHYLRMHVSPILLGADCPFISGEYIAKAINHLPQFDVLFGPAIDGGYVLLALNASKAMQLNWPSLFKGISWGQSSVLQQSLNRCEQHGWDWKLLDSLPDIDRPDELRLLRHLPRFEWLLERG